MKNSKAVSDFVKDLKDTPETNFNPQTNEELFLYYSDLCDALQRTYAIVSFYREEYKKLIPTPENVE